MTCGCGRLAQRQQHPPQKLAARAMRVRDQADARPLVHDLQQVMQERGLARPDLAGDQRDRGAASGCRIPASHRRAGGPATRTGSPDRAPARTGARSGRNARCRCQASLPWSSGQRQESGVGGKECVGQGSRSVTDRGAKGIVSAPEGARFSDTVFPMLHHPPFCLKPRNAALPHQITAIRANAASVSGPLDPNRSHAIGK